MDENPKSLEILKIAKVDLERRQAQMSPQIDAQIEAVLRLCEQRLKEAGEPPHRQGDQHWDAEFNFWHRIITGEVERFRFNEGYEPVAVDLYPATGKSEPAFMGKTQVGRTKFNVAGRWTRDAAGQKILRVTVLKAK